MPFIEDTGNKGHIRGFCPSGYGSHTPTPSNSTSRHVPDGDEHLGHQQALGATSALPVTAPSWRGPKHPCAVAQREKPRCGPRWGSDTCPQHGGAPVGAGDCSQTRTEQRARCLKLEQQEGSKAVGVRTWPGGGCGGTRGAWGHCWGRRSSVLAWVVDMQNVLHDKSLILWAHSCMSVEISVSHRAIGPSPWRRGSESLQSGRGLPLPQVGSRSLCGGSGEGRWGCGGNDALGGVASQGKGPPEWQWLLSLPLDPAGKGAGQLQGKRTFSGYPCPSYQGKPRGKEKAPQADPARDTEAATQVRLGVGTRRVRVCTCVCTCASVSSLHNAHNCL